MIVMVEYYQAEVEEYPSLETVAFVHPDVALVDQHYFPWKLASVIYSFDSFVHGSFVPVAFEVDSLYLGPFESSVVLVLVVVVVVVLVISS
jgi:hypothetical protein